MSLGVESLWRARCCFCLVQGLSLLPGKSRHPLYGSRSQARCRLSSSSASSSASASAVRRLEPPTIQKHDGQKRDSQKRDSQKDDSQKDSVIRHPGRALRAKLYREKQRSTPGKTKTAPTVSSTAPASPIARGQLSVQKLEPPIIHKYNIQKHDVVGNAGRVPRAERHGEPQRSAPAPSPTAQSQLSVRKVEAPIIRKYDIQEHDVQKHDVQKHNIQKHDVVGNAGGVSGAERHGEQQRSTSGKTAPAASRTARRRLSVRKIKAPIIRKYDIEKRDIQKHDVVGNAGRVPRVPRAERKGKRRRSTSRKTTPAASPTARSRLSLRNRWKTRVLGVLSPRTTAMIDPPVQHPDRRASRRNLRKHILSARRQALVEHARRTLRKPYDDWSWTLNLMIRHTPKFDEVLDFKVRIGGGTAAQARAAFSDLDKNLWQLQQRHHGRIQVESGLRDHEPLILSLSGTGVFVRESLSDLAKVVGDVLAVRVLDPTRPIPWPENERENERGEDGDQAEVASRVLGDGDSAGEGETVAVAHDAADFADMAQRPRNKIYRLTTRADEIPRPTVWTKSSFEQYVASLVFARVPTHLHQSLYPVGLSHQATVVHLLTMLFSSEDLRSAVSVSALKMALYFIQSRGRAFRPAARTIFYQVELQHLPLDAEAFQTFLTSASRAGDLQAFNSILTAMYRKGHRTQVATWTSFLAMIRDPGAIYVIVKKMRSRGLLQLRPILEQIGRRRVLLQLERRAHEDLNMLDLLHAQDRWYGPAWLDTMTLNRMVDILGACGNLRACYELLDTVDRDGRVRPDHYTLNTMMTHTRSIPQKITLLSRWPGLDPDGVTYQQLFQAAWKQRLPNVLRVIWRYSVFAGRTNSLMRWMLTKLMRSDSGSDSISDSAMSKNGSARSKRNPTIHKKKYTRSKKMATLRTSKKRVFLKAWEDVILGESQLAAGRLSVGRLSVSHGSPDAFGAWQLKKKYLEDAGPRRLLVRLESKLQEAYGVDMQIHKLNRQGIEMTSAMRKSLTVGIPLGMKSDRR